MGSPLSSVKSKLGGIFSGPDIPKPLAPPAPVDTTEPFIKEMARQYTERRLRQSGGSAAAFGRIEPYRAPGSKQTLGG